MIQTKRMHKTHLLKLFYILKLLKLFVYTDMHVPGNHSSTPIGDHEYLCVQHQSPSNPYANKFSYVQSFCGLKEAFCVNHKPSG